MSWVAVGVAGAAVVGGVVQSNAAGAAADNATAAGRDANQLQWNMYQQQRMDQRPWQDAGNLALYGSGGMIRRKNGGAGPGPGANRAVKENWIKSHLEKLRAEQSASANPFDRMRGKGQSYQDWERIGEDAWANQGMAESSAALGASADEYEVDPELTRSFTMSDFQEDPGYQFRMAEGQKALERSAAARGGLQSGGTMKAIAKYGQDFASNEYGNAYNRFNNDRSQRFNRLSSIAGLGQQANSQMGAAGQNYANQAGQIGWGVAKAQGDAGMAQANAWGQVAQAPTNYLMMSNLAKQNGWRNSPSGPGRANPDEYMS